MMVMTFFARILAAFTIESIVLFRGLEDFDKELADFEAQTVAVEWRREVYGQNAMLESAKTYMEQQRREEVRSMNMRNAMKSEDTEQIAVIQWAKWNTSRYPELKWLHHVPNGGSRNRIEAAKLKQMGVKAGVADLCMPYPKGVYCGLYIEMKFGNNRQQETQKEFLADMAAAGHFVATCYSAEEAVSIIEEYLNLKDATFGDPYAEVLDQSGCRPEEVGQKMNIPNNSILKDGKVTGGAKQ